MQLSLIVAMVEDDLTDDIVKAARQAGATGATVLSAARGEGLIPEKTFLGLTLQSHRDMILFLVAEQKAREILETIAEAGDFEKKPGSGLAFQLPIQDAVGLSSQMKVILEEIEEDV